ncbi:MAG: hypothetical protein BJ554DRAFT_1909, partial [Olpidium bornovanus]
AAKLTEARRIREDVRTSRAAHSGSCSVKAAAFPVCTHCSRPHIVSKTAEALSSPSFPSHRVLFLAATRPRGTMRAQSPEGRTRTPVAGSGNSEKAPGFRICGGVTGATCLASTSAAVCLTTGQGAGDERSRFLSLLGALSFTASAQALLSAAFRCGNYLQYVTIASRAVRNALKEDARAVAQRRDEQSLKFAKWEAGSQGELVSYRCVSPAFPLAEIVHSQRRWKIPSS